MSRWRLRLGLGVGVALLAVIVIADRAVEKAPAEARRHPNIVLVVTDDQDFSELGAYGGKVLTPHLDSLAQEGMRFDRAYVSTALCTPSRYSILTGRYATRSPVVLSRFPEGHYVRVMWNAWVDDGEKTIAHLLKEGGYATGLVGKWMQGSPRGPQISASANPAHPKIVAQLEEKYRLTVEHVRSRGFDSADAVYLANLSGMGIPSRLQAHNQEWITEAALRFIDENKDRPFFLYLATTLPHAPNPYMSLTGDPRITPKGMLPKRIEVQPSRESVIERAQAAGVEKVDVPITWLDDGIGVVLQRISELGLDEDTVIVLVSDHQSRGKMTCYEGARIPFLVRWKGTIAPGQTSSRLVSNVDIVPTLLDIAGVEPPEGMAFDGRSLLPLLLGDEVEDWRKWLYLEVGFTRAVVSDDGWKYLAIRYPERTQARVDAGVRESFGHDGTSKIRYGSERTFPGYFDYDQLYDLNTDPEEQQNLAAEPEQASRLLSMKQRLTRYSESLPHAFGEFKVASEEAAATETAGFDEDADPDADPGTE